MVWIFSQEVSAPGILTSVAADSDRRHALNGRLPFLDGLEATRSIRETGSEDQLELWRSMARAVHAITLTLSRLGVDDSIAKRFDFDWLRDILILLLDSSPHAMRQGELFRKLAVLLPASVSTAYEIIYRLCRRTPGQVCCLPETQKLKPQLSASTPRSMRRFARRCALPWRDQ